MNNIKKFIYMVLIVSMQSLCAENKNVVYIMNHYDRDISVRLTWIPQRGSGFLYDQIEEFIVPKNNNLNKVLSDESFDEKFQHKAPYSKYYLQEVIVIPAANTWGHTNLQVAINTTTAIPSAIIDVGSQIISGPASADARQRSKLIHDLWELSLDKNEVLAFFHEQDKGPKFLVVEDNGKKSKIPGQKQIAISIRSSKDDCEKYILKNELVQDQADKINNPTLDDVVIQSITHRTKNSSASGLQGIACGSNKSCAPGLTCCPYGGCMASC